MSGTPKFSLSFTKKIEKKNLQPSAIRNDAPQEVKEATEILESIEENVMKTDAKVEERELVIPMVVTDRLSVLRKVAEKKLEKEAKSASNDEQNPKEALEGVKGKPGDAVADRPLSLEEQAEAAIIEESKRKLENWTVRGPESNLTILQSEQKALDVSTTSKESSLDDYEEVDISVFGAALLRGMGWKKSEGIGRVNKQVIDIIDPSSKTFGLAGKAGIDGKKPGQDSSGNQEDLILKTGSYVLIHSGRHRGTYGVVESVDEDHLLVKAAVSQEVIREVELNVRVVSHKEYKDSSRVINKDMYDKYKEEEAKQKKTKGKSDNSDSNSEQESKRKEIKMEKWKNEKSDSDRETVSKTTSTEKSKSESMRHSPSPLNYPRKKEEKEDVKKERDEYKADTEHKQESVSERNRNTERNMDERDKYYSKDKHSKYDSYSKYDEKYDRKKGSEDRYRKDDDERYNKSSHRDNYASNTKHHDNKYDSRHIDDSGDRYKEKSKTKNSDSSQKKRKVELDSDSVQHKKGKTLQSQMPAIPWVRENLRVRLISKDYKGGKYHKEKVIVKYVETAENCECVTDDGRILRDVHPEWLETVIPKVDPQIIMIVKGNQKGQRGRILQLHKDQEKASIQLFDDKTVILKLHYDDICEYVSRY